LEIVNDLVIILSSASSLPNSIYPLLERLGLLEIGRSFGLGSIAGKAESEGVSSFSPLALDRLFFYFPLLFLFQFKNCVSP